MTKHAIQTYLVVLALPLFAACGKSRTETTADTAALVTGATRAAETPSTSSIDSFNSVKLDPSEIAEMTDEEIVNTVLTHLKSILANLEAADTSTLPEKVQGKVPTVIAKLTAKIESLENDPTAQASLVAKIRQGRSKPFAGGYEGQTARWKGLGEKFKQSGGSVGGVDKLCSLLEKFMGSSGNSKLAKLKERISGKYQQECSAQ